MKLFLYKKLLCLCLFFKKSNILGKWKSCIELHTFIYFLEHVTNITVNNELQCFLPCISHFMYENSWFLIITNYYGMKGIIITWNWYEVSKEVIYKIIHFIVDLQYKFPFLHMPEIYQLVYPWKLAISCYYLGIFFKSTESTELSFSYPVFQMSSMWFPAFFY